MVCGLAIKCFFYSEHFDFCKLKKIQCNKPLPYLGSLVLSLSPDLLAKSRNLCCDVFCSFNAEGHEQLSSDEIPEARCIHPSWAHFEEEASRLDPRCISIDYTCILFVNSRHKVV